MDWKAYKQAAALPFEVLDCQVMVEKTVEGSRGDHRIDVWIQAQQHGVKTRLLIDCRHWDTPITKADVFALKQVMKDVKGDRALMLSNAGFDSGATKAARSTSITLTTLETIQETAELELTRTTLISLENRITKLKQSLERLSESTQVAPGLWQSVPKPGVDVEWVAKTTEALEAIKFGFAKARLQQPPYFVQKDETTGQPLLVPTVEEFVTKAVVLIEAAESKLKQQHRQVTQARLDAPPVETVAAVETTDAEGVKPEEGEAKPKRSLHAAFFRRKVSTPPVNFAGKDDSSGGSRGDRSGRDGRGGRNGGDRRPARGGKPERGGKGGAFKGRKDRDSGSKFRPGPSEMGPLRARAGGARFEAKRQDAPTFNYSPMPRTSSGEKPKLAGGQSREHSSSNASNASNAAPRLKTGADQSRGRDSFKPQQRDSRDNRAPRSTPSESGGEPIMEGRWWDQPESRQSPRQSPQQRSGHGGGNRAPRLSDGKPRFGGGKKFAAPKLGGKKFPAPKLGGKKFGGQSYGNNKSYGATSFSSKPGGAKKFTPKPALRGGSSGPVSTYSSGERSRKAGKFGARSTGGQFGDRKFGGDRKFSGGQSGRPSFKGSGFKGGKFGGRKPIIGGASSGTKPVLRKQSDSQPASPPQGDGE